MNDLKADDLNSYVLIGRSTLIPTCVTCIYSMTGRAPLAQTGNGARLKSIKPWLWNVVDNYTLQTCLYKDDVSLLHSRGFPNTRPYH